MGHTAAMANTLEEDRPKIAFYGLMMYGNMPDMTQCVDLRFWCGFFALDCFVESFVCLWMAMAGYTRDNLFCLYWVLHLLVALPYVLCTFTIPAAMYADDGKYCRGVDGVGLMAALHPLPGVRVAHAVHLVLLLRQARLLQQGRRFGDGVMAAARTSDGQTKTRTSDGQ